MKKINKSIVFKMFIITFLSIMGLITLIFIIQSTYINYFYKSRKINTIIKNINTFAAEYTTNEWEYEELARNINKFNDVNNVSLFINYKDNQTELNMNEYIVTLQLDNTTYYDIYISKKDLLSIFGEIPSPHNSLYLEALVIDKELLYPLSINSYILENELFPLEQQKKLYKGNAIIINIDNINNILSDNLDNGTTVNIVDSNIIQSHDTTNATDNYNVYSSTNLKTKDNVQYKISNIPFVNLQEAYFYREIKLSNSESQTLEIIASLQPIDEVINILNDYYIFFYLLAIIISLIIAYIYSKLVSKPLLKLTTVANKMAQMDFSEKSVSTRNDELGILSNSLNVLSTNLDNSLSQLKEANKQLIYDIEKEKKQEQVRKEFVANVSHELKTPLGIIKGFAEAIKDGIKKEKSDYYIDVILDETEKMNILILDMLKLSQIEAGKIDSNEDFYIENIIRTITSEFKLQIENKQISVEIEGEFRQVNSVKSQINQVVINLISNAIKYCLLNTTIKIWGEVKKGYNYIYLYNEVEKQLSTEELENIWLRFYKVDKSHHKNNEEIRQTGLGLAIVKAILDGQNCDYGVKNMNNGILFYFSVPIT
jgi:signal transduction histidine kinase